MAIPEVGQHPPDTALAGTGSVASLAAADLASESLLLLEDGQRQWLSWLEWFALNRGGMPLGFGSDLLGEMHAFQCDEFRIRAKVVGNLEALRSATTVAADIVDMKGMLGLSEITHELSRTGA